jgi:hypothetical protein
MEVTAPSRKSSRSRLDPSACARFLLALVLVSAAVLKARSTPAAAMHSSFLSFLLTSPVTHIAAAVIEGGLGVALLTRAWAHAAKSSMVWCAALLGLQAAAWWRGINISQCSCLGAHTLTVPGRVGLLFGIGLLAYASMMSVTRYSAGDVRAGVAA